MTEAFQELLTTLKPRILSLVYESDYGFIKNGNSRELGGVHDREILLNLRSRSDLLVTTGKTAELEQYTQPAKPLILITTRVDAASWLEAKRMTINSPELIKLTDNKIVLFETGLQVATLLFEKGFIDQVVIHHDKKVFDPSELLPMNLETTAHVPYYDRYISVFERRGNQR